MFLVQERKNQVKNKTQDLEGLVFNEVEVRMHYEYTFTANYMTWYRRERAKEVL